MRRHVEADRQRYTGASIQACSEDAATQLQSFEGLGLAAVRTMQRFAESAG
jgi:hypothetical protein